MKKNLLNEIKAMNRIAGTQLTKEQEIAIIKNRLQELEFGTQKAFDAYKKNHDMRPDTKVKVAGKNTTAGQAAKQSKDPVVNKSKTKPTKLGGSALKSSAEKSKQPSKKTDQTKAINKAFGNSDLNDYQKNNFGKLINYIGQNLNNKDVDAVQYGIATIDSPSLIDLHNAKAPKPFYQAQQAINDWEKTNDNKHLKKAYDIVAKHINKQK